MGFGAALPLANGIGTLTQGVAAGAAAVGTGVAAAGTAIGVAALAAGQAVYDEVVNKEGVIYGKNGEIVDYTRSARIGAFLQRTELPSLGQDRFETTGPGTGTPAAGTGTPAAGTGTPVSTLPARTTIDKVKGGCGYTAGAGAVGAGVIAHNSRQEDQGIQHTAASIGTGVGAGAGVLCEPESAVKGAVTTGVVSGVGIGIYNAGEESGKRKSPPPASLQTPLTQQQTPPASAGSTNSPSPDPTPQPPASPSPEPSPIQTPGN